MIEVCRVETNLSLRTGQTGQASQFLLGQARPVLARAYLYWRLNYSYNCISINCIFSIISLHCYPNIVKNFRKRVKDQKKNNKNFKIPFFRHEQPGNAGTTAGFSCRTTHFHGAQLCGLWPATANPATAPIPSASSAAAVCSATPDFNAFRGTTAAAWGNGAAAANLVHCWFVDFWVIF